MNPRTLLVGAALAVGTTVAFTVLLAPDTGDVPERRRPAPEPKQPAAPPPRAALDASPYDEHPPARRPDFDPEVLRQLSAPDPRHEVVWAPTVGDPAALAPDDGTPLSPDVAGVERLVRRSGEDVYRCGQLHLPSLRGQRRVVVRFELVPEGGGSRIAAMAPDFVPDPEFWQPFVTCLRASLAEVRFATRPDPITVYWPVAW
jgi:hypothetical protein